jgi:hypothetical protein
MKDRLVQVMRQPAAPLIPWAGFALLLVLCLAAVHHFGADRVRQDRDRLETDWAAARHTLVRHREAKKLRQDLAKVWAMLPDEQDFSSLALGISEEAKKDRVTLPAMSSKTEPTPVAQVSRGVLEGSMSGRYEDLRRFIYALETAEEPLFIEDLELARVSGQASPIPTFNVKIVTFLRRETARVPIQAGLR